MDRGGTFTDLIAVSPDGRLLTGKVLSQAAPSTGDAIVEAILALLPHGEPVESIRIGTTVATNALLTRTGVPTVLIVTRGLGDLAWIRDQTRPDLFALDIRRPEPTATRIVEAAERTGANGAEIEPLDASALRNDLELAHSQGCRAAAVCLMHGWKHPAHEQQAAEIAARVGFETVLTSADAGMCGYVARLATLSADASLTPLLRRSLGGVTTRFSNACTLGMQSNGGLVHLDRFRGVNAILSGPAGGIVGAATAAQAAGLSRVVTLDMGGTSTDVAWWDGRLHRCDETHIAGERLRVPMLEIHTIAAGGGSICSFDGQRMRVGPDSAGAYPGPACYGLGGPPAITDCNVVLGRVPPTFLPPLFGPMRNQPLNSRAARVALADLRDRMAAAGHAFSSIEHLADGFLAIAVEAIAAAVRRISIEQGRDLRGAALVAFGGAGGQLACRIADALTMDVVLLHPLAGILSAWGIGCADRRALRRASLEAHLDAEGIAAAHALADELQTRCQAEVGLTAPLRVERRAVLRLPDWEHGLEVLLTDTPSMQAAFVAACLARFGYEPGGSTVIAAVEVEAIAPGTPVRPRPPRSVDAAPPRGHTPLWCAGQVYDAPWFERVDLAAGQVIPGPALVREDGATTVIDPGWRAAVDADGALRLQRAAPAHPARPDDDLPIDAARLAVFGHRFRAIADEMGAALQSAARSVNMRVRLDYSCAVFDAAGNLVANGAHIPVHLGSMSHSVRHIIAMRAADLCPGDAFLLNDPFHGGTHLPDLTVVSPFFDESGQLQAFVASRGHHVDVGGLTPGSMPPDAKTLADEGVVIDNFRLVRQGVLRRLELLALLGTGPHPCRMPDRVVDDLRAQLAANCRGLDSLAMLVREQGLQAVRTSMALLQDHAADCIAARLRTLRDGHALTPVDAGGQIAVQMRVDPERSRVTFDFSGTSGQRADNANAPPAVTRAAVLYVLRCLVADDIPLNDGCLRHVEINLPEGCMLNPRSGAAVAAGNVETSQLVVDTLMRAADVMADSQGTMNNLTFGDGRFQYYETMCGGSGAGPTFAGAHAVHTHMTNSRLTDPEILEDRYPVRVWRFARRFGSGGRGHNPGGDGAVREIEFLAPMTFSIIAGRRQHPPRGLHSGGDAQPGRQTLLHAGLSIELPGRCTRQVGPGDRLILETPGAGAWGQLGGVT
ncbi:MAG: 5-oxoprolinase [Leptolyngbya sp. PLA3]|nr:MAG: 5-oxoprolinase [Cyanobacteria bacterium CYA]MCE7968783.1 5-oxoprolinase [Leptolyngbya sp. PL-A3]